MKKITKGLLALCLGLSIGVTAQNKSVSIGTLIPDNSAILDLESATQGFLMTRQDSAQIKAIVSPANGLIVFNIQDQCYWFKRTARWERICSTDSLSNLFVNTRYIKADTAIINYLTANYAKIDTLISNYINVKKIAGDTAIFNYISAIKVNLDTIINNLITSKTTKTDSLYVNGTAIQTLIKDSINADAWLLHGNSGTNPAVNFLGTKDNADLVFRTFNTEQTRILASNGYVGIGTPGPTDRLHIMSPNGELLKIQRNAGSNQDNTMDMVFTSNTFGSGLLPGGSLNFMFTGINNADIAFINNTSAAGTPANVINFIIKNSGFVGVGVNNPATLFSVGALASNFQVDGNGVTYLQNGSLALPQLTFINDNTTGLYRPGANQFAVSVGGIQGLWFSSFNKSIYLGMVGSSATLSSGTGNIIIGKGSNNGGGSNNILSGGSVNGNDNLVLSTNYNTSTTSVTGTGNAVIGYSNTVNAATSGTSYIFGTNNTLTPTGLGAGMCYVIGDNNSNTGSGIGQTVMIGQNNQVTSTTNGSIAIGGYINLQHNGNVVFSSGSGIGPPQYLTTTKANMMLARFEGGYTFFSNTSEATGVSLAAGGGSWASVSDRNAKENFTDIKTEDILVKLAKLKAVEWQYIAQRPDSKVNDYQVQPRHIGIMAQDFYAAFGYGEYSNKITQTDIDGVMTAAIQALGERTDKIADLEKEVAELKAMVLKLANQK